MILQTFRNICFGVFDILNTVYTHRECTGVWTTHSASMSAQQVSFPHSPVRHWFLFWERSPKWHQFPPRHNSSPWHRTKTFLTQREEHHAWHIYSRGLCSTLPSSLTPPFSQLMFAQPPALFTASSKSFSDFNGSGSLTWPTLLVHFNFKVSLPCTLALIHIWDLWVNLTSSFSRLLF